MTTRTAFWEDKKESENLNKKNGILLCMKNPSIFPSSGPQWERERILSSDLSPFHVGC